jgi:hypothetical protein
MAGTFIIPPGGTSANTITPNLAPVLDNELFTPPVSPNENDSYIVAKTSPATGDWVGREDDIATWDGAAWVFYTPISGDITTILTGTNAGKIIEFDGSDWVIDTTPSVDSTPLYLLGTEIDAGANKVSDTWREGGLVLGSDVSLLGNKFRVVGSSRLDNMTSRNGFCSTNVTSRTNKWYLPFSYKFLSASASADTFTIFMTENGDSNVSGHQVVLNVSIRKVSGVISVNVFIDQKSKDYAKFVDNFDVLYNATADTLSFYYRPTKDTSNTAFTLLSVRGANISDRFVWNNQYLNATDLTGQTSDTLTKNIIQSTYVADMSGVYTQQLTNLALLNLGTAMATLTLGLDTNGRVVPQKDYSYSIAFVGAEEECPELIAKNNTITAVTLSSQIASYELSVNGGSFAVPSLPLSLTAGNELVWKIVYESGEDKGNINITANI